MKKKLIQWLLCIIFLFGLIPFKLNAQELLLNPSGTILKLSNDIPEYICPDFDLEAIKKEDHLNDLQNVSPVRFAKGFDLDISTDNSGTWETIDDINVWRYKITSSGAFSMNALLEDISLPENASLFIYNEDMSYVIGPIKSVINQYGVFFSEFVPGASIVIELVIDRDFKPGTRYFTITGVAHDYNDFFSFSNYSDDSEFGQKIDNCINVDVNCAEGTEWQTHKKAVALMVINIPRQLFGNKDVGYCTGALVNNTNFDGKSLFLTAEHCLNGAYYTTEERLNRTLFYFNHESNGCGSKKEHPYNFAISGATLKSASTFTDFALIELHSRIPSSYNPYFAGWDKSGRDPQKGVAIHHPRANLKKIAFENDSFSFNTSVVNNFAIGTLWHVKFDLGGVTYGSSGSPLFNENKKIIGQLFGGENKPGCDNQKRYGRLSVSWNQGSTPLKNWLDPNNSNPNEILGYIPAGWRNDWLTGWNQPATHKMHVNIKSLAVGTGGQVFYRGTDNKMQMYWFNSSTNKWVHDWVRGYNIPNYELIAGDVVVGEGNQLFYRGADGKIHTYYWTSAGWMHDWLTGWNSSSDENVSDVPGSIAVGVGNQIFYRGADNKMHTYYWDSTGWHHGFIVNNAPISDRVGGDVVVGTDGGQNQVYYRGTDGKTHVYWYNNSSSQWVHGVINSSSTNVSGVAGSMEVGQFNHIYYRGTDNKMYVHSFNTSLNAWQTSTFLSNPGNDQKASGNITSMPGQVMYRGTDGKMHVYWFNSATSQWVHDWIENSWQAPSLNNITGSIDAGQGDQVFYRGHDGLVRVYYFGNSAVLRPENSESENKNSAMIPNYKSILEMVVYPNPVGDNLNINISSAQEDKFLFTLIDLSGKTVFSQEKGLKQGFNKVEIQFINKIKSGLYIFTAQNIRTLEKSETKIIKL